MIGIRKMSAKGSVAIQNQRKSLEKKAIGIEKMIFLGEVDTKVDTPIRDP